MAKKKNNDEEVLKKIIDEMGMLEAGGDKKEKPLMTAISVKKIGKKSPKKDDEELPEGENKLPDVLDNLDDEENYEEELEEEFDEDIPVHEVPIEKIPGLEGEDDDIAKGDPWPGVKEELASLRKSLGKIESMIGKGYYNE